MKQTIEIKGKVYERSDRIMERCGISFATLRRLTRTGAAPVKLGRKAFYPIEEVEDRLASSAVTA